MKSFGGSFQSKNESSVIILNVNKNVNTASIPSSPYSNIFSSEQITALSSIKYTNGQNIINFGVSGNNDVLYEIISRLQTGTSFDQILSFLNSKNWESDFELYFSFPEFDNARYAFDKFIESYHDDREIQKGIYICPKCKSDETISASMQTRAADEGETVKAICLTCQFSWKV